MIATGEDRGYPQSVRYPFPPVGQEKIIASRSHTNQQAAHSMHLSRVDTHAFPPDILKQPARQTFKQRAQPSQLSPSTLMKGWGVLFHSTPGNLLEARPRSGVPLPSLIFSQPVLKYARVRPLYQPREPLSQAAGQRLRYSDQEQVWWLDDGKQ